MSILNRINQKLSFRMKSLLGSVAIIAIVSIIVSSTLLSSLKKEIIERAKVEAVNASADTFHKVDKYLNEKTVLIQQTGRLVGGVMGLSEEERNNEILNFLQIQNIDNPEIVSVWIYYDDAGFGSEELTEVHYFNRGGQLLSETNSIFKSEMKTDHVHMRASLKKKEALSEVYISNLWDENVPAVTLSVPFFYQGNLAGTVCAELSLHALADMVNNEYIVSESNTIIVHPDQRKNAMNIVDARIDKVDVDFLQKVMVDESDIETDLDNYIVHVINAFELGKSGSFWRLYSNHLYADEYKEYKIAVNYVIVFIILGLIVLAYGLYYLNSRVTGALQYSQGVISELSEGKVNVNGIDSGRMASREGIAVVEGLMKLSENLHGKIEFTKNLIGGKLDVDYKVNDEDVLGNSLLSLRSSLMKSSEEARKRQWINEGLARFSDILRGSTDNFEELTVDIISNLVKYMETNQGVIFLLTEDDDGTEYLKLSGAYAYERRKFIDAKLKIDEGLVGQCFKEKQSIHLTEIPKNYVRITSGLGKAVPTAVLLVPLMIESEVNGVIEIAGFSPFEDYEISFVEKLAESIALTLHNARNNQATKLLLEKSQLQAEELRSAEEEMRQNMEELQATQEELNRRAKEMEELLRETEQKGEYSSIQIEISNTLNSKKTRGDFYNSLIEEASSYLAFDFAHAIIVKYEEDGVKLVSSGKYYSNDEELHREMIDASSNMKIDLEKSIYRKCVEEGEVLYFEKLLANEQFGRRDPAEKAGLNYSIAFPMKNHGRVVSLIEFYKADLEEDSEILFDFMSQLADVVSSQLTWIALIEDTSQNQIKLIEKQKDYWAIVDNLFFPIVVFDFEGKIENVNSGFSRIFDVTPRKLHNKNIFDFIENGKMDFEMGESYEFNLIVGESLVPVKAKSTIIRKNAGPSHLLQFEII